MNTTYCPWCDYSLHDNEAYAAYLPKGDGEYHECIMHNDCADEFLDAQTITSITPTPENLRVIRDEYEKAETYQ